MNWLENMILQTKLMLLTGILVIALAILGWMGYSATVNWKTDVEEIGNLRTPSLMNVGTTRNGIQLAIIQQNRVRGLKDDPERVAKMNNALEQINAAFERAEGGIKANEALEQSEAEKVEWKKFKDGYAGWLAESKRFNAHIEKIIKASDSEEVDTLFQDLTQSIEGVRPVRTLMLNAIQEVYNINRNAVKDIAISANEKATNFNQVFTIVALASIIFAILFAWALIRSISRAITQSVTTIRDGAMQITSASDQVASSSSSLAQGASEQASSVEEVSATLEESTAINTQNTDNARQADILAKNANDSARAGYQKGEQLAQSMHAITESAAKISGIIKAIDQIAFQTNLLALNAAVEAARAGEHGLGFAVVADEVRNLAQRAASAAKETSDIIEEVVEQIKEGNDIAHATHTSFQEIVEQSKKVSDLIGEISIAGKEQSEGMTQINQAMGQVDQVTQQVAANSEEAAAAAEELNAQASSMMETVRILAKMVGMESDAPMVTQKKKPLHQMEIKKPVTMQKKPNAPKNTSSTNRAEEIFPLHEDDLKEF
ncbi:MAG: methyl-accepting chemotaxis protein [Sulfurimonas sp.]|uniref:methyl-accepting chemotaxis protein n=1 Tax=Sulfurimonas sp. TaxID=2022749 RepID=UPI003D1163F0